jgi:hypothetical protein
MHSQRNVSGHLRLVERDRGPQFYVKYRLADGRQMQRRLGPAWTGKGRPPAGHYTRRTAQAALDAILTDAQRGTLAGHVRTGATFGDAAAEWLRYVEHDRKRRTSTVGDYRLVVSTRLIPVFGADTPLEARHSRTGRCVARPARRRRSRLRPHRQQVPRQPARPVRAGAQDLRARR